MSVLKYEQELYFFGGLASVGIYSLIEHLKPESENLRVVIFALMRRSLSFSYYLALATSSRS